MNCHISEIISIKNINKDILYSKSKMRIPFILLSKILKFNGRDVSGSLGYLDLLTFFSKLRR